MYTNVRSHRDHDDRNEHTKVITVTSIPVTVAAKGELSQRSRGQKRVYIGHDQRNQHTKVMKRETSIPVDVTAKDE